MQWAHSATTKGRRNLDLGNLRFLTKKPVRNDICHHVSRFTHHNLLHQHLVQLIGHPDRDWGLGAIEADLVGDAADE